MKSIRMFVVLLACCWVFPAQANGVDLIPGLWTSSSRSPAGQEILNSVEFKADNSFSGQARVGDTVFFTYRGTWSLEDDRFVWQYLDTTPPLPPAARVVTDQVVLLNGATLILLSKQSGNQRTFTKTTPSPAGAQSPGS